MKAIRLTTNPLVRLEADPSIGDNINGPSLIRVPEWVANRLGRYYLYFAHHAGRSIRLAVADEVEGPWRIHREGSLQLRESGFRWAVFQRHIASPDVHVDEEHQRIVMFYHGGYLLRGLREGMKFKSDEGRGESSWRIRLLTARQATRVAVSEDGLHFRKLGGIVGPAYWRRFTWQGRYYALAMPGVFYQSEDGVAGYRRLGGDLFTPRMRHAATLVEGDRLRVFYTNAGDAPEEILCSTIALHTDSEQWRMIGREKVLSPETEYEGGDLPIAASRRGLIVGRARQLRDPCVFVEEEKRYLLYSAAGENAIAGAVLVD